MNTEDKLVIYQAADGAIELPVDAKLETIWASQRFNCPDIPDSSD